MRGFDLALPAMFSSVVPKLLFLIGSLSLGARSEMAIERVGLGETLLLRFQTVRRVAISSAIVKIKTIAPDGVLLFGKKEGTAILTVWKENDETQTREIQVIASPRGDPARGRERLIKVLIELIEFDSRRLEELGVRWPASQALTVSVKELDLWGGKLHATAMLSSIRGRIFHYAQQGAAKLLTSPELYVREGEEAIFHSGGEFPVSSSTEAYGNIQRRIDWKSFGVRIKIRPRSPDGFHISSDVDVEISELNSGMAIDGVPSVTKRSISTKVDAADQETLLLSGLHRTREGKERQSVPVVEKLPIVGPLFSMRRKESETTELIMAMTLSFAGRGGREKAESFRERWRDDGDPVFESRTTVR